MAKNPTKKSAEEARRQIQVLDRDLYHLRRVRESYSRRMLRMGMVMWVVGVLVFSFSIFIWVGFDTAVQNPHVWLPLLIIALAAPNFISAAFVRRLVIKERRLEQLRKNLVDRFEKAMLKKMERMVTKK